MLKKIWMFAIIALVSLFVTIWFQASQQQQSVTTTDNNTGQQNSSITIGYSDGAGWRAWKIAEDENFFDEHDLNVELKFYDDYSESLKDLAEGKIDANCQTLRDTLLTSTESKDGEVVVLVSDNSIGNEKLISDEGFQNFRQGTSPNILVEPGTLGDYFLSLVLEKENLNRTELDITEFKKTEKAVSAFAKGKGDIVSAHSPYWMKAYERKNAKEFASSADFPGAMPNCLVVTQKFLDNYSEEVKQLLQVWFEIDEFIANNPNKSEEIIVADSQLSKEELKLSGMGIKMFNLDDNAKAFSDDPGFSSLFYSAEKMSNFLSESFQDFQKPNIEKLIDPEFIRVLS